MRSIFFIKCSIGAQVICYGSMTVRALGHPHLPLLCSDHVEGRSLRGLASIYSFQLRVPAWEQRHDSAVYRGSCYATLNPHGEMWPPYQTRAFLARLCHFLKASKAVNGSLQAEDGHCHANLLQRHNTSSDGEAQAQPPERQTPGTKRDHESHVNAPKCPELSIQESLHATQLPEGSFDIGFKLKHSKTMCHLRDAPGLCKACKCCLSEGRMSLSDMLKFKYQILVDGYSASWDSSFWKLSSNSVVFFLRPQSEQLIDSKQCWALWWYPSLREGGHFIHASVQELPGLLNACLKKEKGEPCRHIARRAQAAVREAASFTATLQYLFQVLSLVQNVLAPM
ncbi:hypothetical protein CEUSTIGMA_g569.t1 [Chlamydomonas eustigma]|uniref:Glycosyl transferase CAP10 domain-containing protein n=1 Tax=Chlamydomonas eustigma TaxID=1157962 RepID=A0A250WQZ4_9CHLO|nr:hypothetical protein CEUSTIGMA_g569.t1 [Chlamydomonas eustigma]|eukprot:GAX73116.1 hypothetical protein CEUSTIGMA_g569.t1 [Chlamydomonas eustigma]